MIRGTLPIVALVLASCSAAPVLDLTTSRRVLEPARSPVPSAAVRLRREANAAAPKVPAQSLVEGSTLTAPSGFLSFCAANPSDCEGSAGRQVAWDGPTQRQVQSVNAAVNESIEPQGEAFERWSVDVAAGDCEDYVLTKRRRLVQGGLPASSLRVAVASTAAGEMHAVLVVKTASGDFVLDNRNDSVLPPEETDLHWIKMATAEDPRVWRTIRPVSDTL